MSTRVALSALDQWAATRMAAAESEESQISSRAFSPDLPAGVIDTRSQGISVIDIRNSIDNPSPMVSVPSVPFLPEQFMFDSGNIPLYQPDVVPPPPHRRVDLTPFLYATGDIAVVPAAASSTSEVQAVDVAVPWYTALTGISEPPSATPGLEITPAAGLPLAPAAFEVADQAGELTQVPPVLRSRRELRAERQQPGKRQRSKKVSNKKVTNDYTVIQAQELQAPRRKLKKKDPNKGIKSLSAPQVGIVSVLGLATIAAPLAGSLSAPGQVTVAYSGDNSAAASAFVPTDRANTGTTAPMIVGDDGSVDSSASSLLAPQKVLVTRAARGGREEELLAGCSGNAPSMSGVSNGNLPSSKRCTLWKDNSGETMSLRSDAAMAFAQLNVVYRSKFGKNLCLVDSYRSLSEQYDIKKTRGSYAATPGTSEHGWGIAVDLCGGSGLGHTATYTWLKAHAATYGWENPTWAGPNYEPWHWEYVPGRK